MVKGRYQKWNELDDISEISNFQAADVKVRDVTVILRLRKLTRLVRKNAA